MKLIWNGRDEYGSKIGRGVYIYRLSVRTSDGSRTTIRSKSFICYKLTNWGLSFQQNYKQNKH